jgi:hypothetical protein
MLYSWNSQLRGASVESAAACSVSPAADLIITYSGCTALQPDAPHSACHNYNGPSTQLAAVFQGFTKVVSYCFDVLEAAALSYLACVLTPYVSVCFTATSIVRAAYHMN